MYITVKGSKKTGKLFISDFTLVDKLYLFSVFLIALNCIIRKSLLGDYTKWMACFTYISWACMLIRLLYCKHSLKSLLNCVICLVISIFCFFYTGELAATIFLLRVFASTGIDEGKIIKVSFYSYMIGFVIVVINSLLGVIPLLDQVGNYTMGFTNVNSIGGFIGLFIVIKIYLNFDTLKMCSFIGLIIINSSVLYWTGNRTTCFAVFGIIFFTWYLNGKSESKKRIMYLAVGGAMGAFVLLLIGIICFKNTSPYLVINRILSGRLFQGNYYYNKYRISLWGTTIPELKEEGWHRLLDMGYAQLIMLRGVIFSGIFIFALYRSIIQRIRSEDIPAFLLLFYVAIHLLIEPFFCDMNLNIAIVFFSSVFSSKYLYGNYLTRKYKVNGK